MRARQAVWAAILISCAEQPSEPRRPAPTPGIAAKATPEPTASAPTPPSATEAPPPPAPPDPGRANTDPGDDDVVGPPEAIPDCHERLLAAKVRFHDGSIPIRPSAGGSCGAAQVIVYEEGPQRVKWNAAPVVSCQLALGLARFESVLVEEAERTLGSRITRIQQGGTYSCRRMARFRLASEHSYANAIDLLAFELADGRRLSVKRHFGKLDAEPTTPESIFLRTTACRAFDEGSFSVVLTPFWDALHADHFHLDQARYRVNACRPR